MTNGTGVTAEKRSRLPQLKGAQAEASAPDIHVWLSASAGTGKTQVLSARVFRLLLRGVAPESILCLTFTKAGAAEMAHRVNERLAAWVRLPETELSNDLEALGERTSPALRARARTLFARILDAPGGGLRVQTIHGFCQSLLAAFPLEAGLAPGFRPLEAREEAGIAREALATLLQEADQQGRTSVIHAIGALSLRLGEGGAEAFLLECARAPVALEALPTGIKPWLRRALDLPNGDIVAAISAGCAALDQNAIDRIGSANRSWDTIKGAAAAETVTRWLAADDALRGEMLKDLADVVLTAAREPRKVSKKLIAADPDYEELASALGNDCLRLMSLDARLAYADLLADALSVGREYARAYADAKRRIGAVDFDDLIRTTVELLEQPGIGEWVRYKLDQVTEHVLIDEAQDTNVNQWRIVKAIADEFFVGRGSYAPSTRTLFTVGDHKQAIFGFQGTDPINFAAAEQHYDRLAASALGDADLPEADRGLPFSRLSLTHSFRSTEPVLQFVDAAVSAIGEPGLGMVGDFASHASEVPGPGAVTLWPPVVEGEGNPDEDEGWVDDATRKLAGQIAAEVKRWLAEGLMLESKDRALRPEDVMILVKRRGDLAALIVARLYSEGVPVAGVDRLRLNSPLGIQDLLAAIRFVLQPNDDLSLASLLVSPLIGWSQEQLLAAAPRQSGSLWRHLGLTLNEANLAPLRAMLARADLVTPYQFLEELLSGPLDGRRKMLRRLGPEARDPIDELLAAALAFERTTTPSLQRFLDWFDRGDVDIVRDPSAPLDAVRVMTVHGAKGLQAPLVILADATVDPGAAPRSSLRWVPEPGAQPIPILLPRADESGGPLDQVVEAEAKRALQEHWRLFYVAATRAEERLVITGSLGPRARGVPPATSWYAVSSFAIDALGVAPDTQRREFKGNRPLYPVKAERKSEAKLASTTALPEWARRPAPPELRPSRPLAPSSIGEDRVSDPAYGEAMRAAAERGRLVHALFERLPAVAPSDRPDAADRWLRRVGDVADRGERERLAATVLNVLNDPSFSKLFGPSSLAEAPIAATIEGGFVVSGKVDRLLIEDDRVSVIDFKTGRAVPNYLDDIPRYHLRQMAAYVEALEIVFPKRQVDAALLYTGGPKLFRLPRETLDRFRPDFATEA